jgi:hypothetical protein
VFPDPWPLVNSIRASEDAPVVSTTLLVVVALETCSLVLGVAPIPTFSEESIVIAVALLLSTIPGVLDNSIGISVKAICFSC